MSLVCLVDLVDYIIAVMFMLNFFSTLLIDLWTESFCVLQMGMQTFWSAVRKLPREKRPQTTESICAAVRLLHEHPCVARPRQQEISCPHIEHGPQPCHRPGGICVIRFKSSTRCWAVGQGPVADAIWNECTFSEGLSTYAWSKSDDAWCVQLTAEDFIWRSLILSLCSANWIDDNIPSVTQTENLVWYSVLTGLVITFTVWNGFSCVAVACFIGLCIVLLCV